MSKDEGGGMKDEGAAYLTLLQKQARYMREWRARHRERARTYQRDYMRRQRGCALQGPSIRAKQPQPTHP